VFPLVSRERIGNRSLDIEITPGDVIYIEEMGMLKHNRWGSGQGRSETRARAKIVTWDWCPRPANKRRELPSIVNRGARGPRGATSPGFCLRDDPWWMAGAGPVAQGNAFLYKGAKSRARDGQ
jgi:hypothetical protein